jgi:hypothetical protein
MLEDCHENPFAILVKEQAFLPGFSRNDAAVFVRYSGGCFSAHHRIVAYLKKK